MHQIFVEVRFAAQGIQVEVLTSARRYPCAILVADLVFDKLPFLRVVAAFADVPFAEPVAETIMARLKNDKPFRLKINQTIAAALGV